MSELDEALEMAMRWKDEPTTSFAPNRVLGILSRALLDSRVELINAATRSARPEALRTTVPDGFKLLRDSTHDERSWPEDASHENGNYYCLCGECGRQFTGHKRRGLCKVCVVSPPLRNIGCEAHTDVRAPHCPICLDIELSELRAFYEGVSECMADTWECHGCGISHPWWKDSNADYATKEAAAKISARSSQQLESKS